MSYTGNARVMDAKALELLGTVEVSPAAVLDQYAENCADAGATQIWVVLEPGRIAVVDNGHGMIPDLLPEDRDYYAMFLEDVETKRVSPGFDLRDSVSTASLCSVRWMMECVAYSAKRPREGDRTRGMRGIGAQGFRQMAKMAVWYTRPSADLAELYWGGANLPSKRAPTVKVVPPTPEQLSRFDTTYHVYETDEPLLDPYGRPLEHGTRFEMTQLLSGLENAVRPDALQVYLQGRLGEDIRQRRFRLVIIDRATEAARRAGGTREIEVQPPVYRGILVVDKTAYLRGGRAPFRIQIYYDPNGRGLRVAIRRKGGDVALLTALSEFDKPPFNSGRVSGFVEFPDLPEREAPLDLRKELPLESPVRNQWQKEVWECVPAIEEAVSRVEERTRERRFEDLARDLAAVAIEAITETPFFRDLVIGGLPRVSGGRRKTGKPSPVPDRSTAVVFDEHNRGVEGMTLELVSDGKLVNRLTTGKSGIISFGKLPFGRYILRLVAPDDVTVLEPSSYTFNISEGSPGHRAVFRVFLHTPEPESRRIRRIEFVRRAYSDPFLPYRENLAHGRIEINTESVDWRRASDTDDEELKAALLAQYTASAVAEYGSPGDPKLALIGASLLFGKMYERIARRPRGRREAVARRRNN